LTRNRGVSNQPDRHVPPSSTTCSNRHTPQVLTTPLALRRVIQFVDRLDCGEKTLELDTDRKGLACGTKTLCPHLVTISSYVYFLNSIAYMPVTQNWIIVITSYRICNDIVSNSGFCFQ
jgi:hypothetical protein